MAEDEIFLDEIGRTGKMGAWRFDVATGAGSCTAGMARMHELDPDEPVSLARGMALYPPHSRARIELAIAETIERRTPYDIEVELITRSGARKWVRAIGRPIIDGDRVVELRGTFQDITELRQAEAERARGDELLRLIVESSPGAVAMFDREMRYLAVSRRFSVDLGIDGANLIGRCHYDVFPDLPARWREAHGRCLAGGTERCAHDPWPRANGTTEWITWEIRPWHGADGAIGGIVLFSEVVTERERAERALRESERRFRELFERSPIGKAEVDVVSGRFLQVNAKLCELLGRSADELLGLTWIDITHPDDVLDGVAATVAMREGSADRFARDSRAIRPDGTTVWCRVTVSRGSVAPDGATTLFVVLEDITELRDSEAQVRAMLETVPVGLALLEQSTGRIARANARLAEILGYTRDELIGRSIRDLTHPDDRERTLALAAEVRAGRRRVGQLEKRYLRKDGTEVWSDVRIAVLRDGARDVATSETVVTVDDISARRAAETTLRLLTSALHAAANGVAITDVRGVVQWVNDAFTRLTGYGAGECIGRSMNILRSGRQDAEFYRRLWDAILAGEVWSGELVNRRKDGSEYDEDMTITPVRDACGTITHFIAIKQDVTERKRAEQALRDSEARLRAAIDGMPVAIVLADRNGTTLHANGAFVACFGYAAADVPTSTAWMEAAYPDPAMREQVRAQWVSDLERAAGDGVATAPRLYSVMRHDGAARDVEIVGRRIGELMIVVFHDVTEQRRAAAALIESEERQRLALQAGDLATWRHHIATDRVELDDRARRVLELDDRVVNVDQVRARLHPDDAFTDEQRRELLEVGHSHFVRRVVAPSGANRWLSCHLEVHYDTEAGARRPRFVTVISRDVTVERRAEEELRASEERYRRLVDSLDDVIFSLDPDGLITFVSRAVERFGYTPQRCTGRSMLSFVHEDDHAHMRDVLARRLAGEICPPTECRMLDASGGVRHLRITTRADADGRGLAGIAVDVTAQRSTEEQLRAAQKMEAIGRLAGGVAHDFNNLLTVILSFAELAQGTLRGEDPLRDDLDEIIRATTRAAGLTRQLLAFSRRQVLQPEPVDLDELIATLGKMLHRLIGEDIELVLEPSSARARAMVDRGQIEQVVMNLVVNARDAMPGGGRLRVATGAIALDGDDARAIDLSPGRYVKVSVADTGCGMDAATRARIFEPFFTTKEQGKGTGLGLSTVYGIVKQSRGAVTVESTPGTGSTFVVYLPIGDGGAASVQVPSPRAPSRGSETILLVEDELQVRTALVRLLSASGYQPLVAGTPSEALRLAAERGREVRLVITDVVMPEMNGRELAMRLGPLCPSARILYTSGYTDDALLRSGVLGEEFLAKPFDPTTFSRRIRTLLDAGPPR